MNRFEIEGNLARDAYYSEPKSKDGKATAIMTVAVSRTSASGTDFITVKLFGTLQRQYGTSSERAITLL